MPDWQFLERQAPGCRAAWQRDVGLPDDEFTIGTTGSRRLETFRVVAFDRDWVLRTPSARRHFTFDVKARRWAAP